MPRQQSLRGHDVHHLDDCRRVSDHRAVAADAVSRRFCGARPVRRRRVCVDARARPATRAETGIFRGVDQSARGDHFAGVWRIWPGRGGGGNVFDAAARLEIPQTSRRAVAPAADSTAGNHRRQAGARRAGALHHRPRRRQAFDPARRRQLLAGPEGGLVHFHVGGLSGVAGLAPDARAVKSRLRHQRHRCVCVSAPDLLGHQPAFTPASSMNQTCRVSGVPPVAMLRRGKRVAGNSPALGTSRHSSRVTRHLFAYERRRHRPEPPFVARGTAGTVCLCRGEDSRCAQIAARIRHRRRSRDSLDVQSCGNLRGDGAGTRQGICRIEEISSHGGARLQTASAARSSPSPRRGEGEEAAEFKSPRHDPAGRSEGVRMLATNSNSRRAAKPASPVQGCVRPRFDGSRRDRNPRPAQAGLRARASPRPHRRAAEQGVSTRVQRRQTYPHRDEHPARQRVRGIGRGGTGGENFQLAQRSRSPGHRRRRNERKDRPRPALPRRAQHHRRKPFARPRGGAGERTGRTRRAIRRLGGGISED